MKLSSREIVGIILWWAEGTKSRRDKRWKNARSYPIEITNTNPAIIMVFLDFLRYDLKVDEEKIRLQLQIHMGDNQAALEKYWSELTNISSSKFNKTIIRPVGNKIGKSMGTCKMRFADKKTYYQLERLLSEVLAELYENPQETLKTLPHYEMLS